MLLIFSLKILERGGERRGEERGEEREIVTKMTNFFS